MVCSEIDEFETDLKTSIKTTSKEILTQYKALVEDESFSDFSSDLSKMFSNEIRIYQKVKWEIESGWMNTFKMLEITRSWRLLKNKWVLEI